MRADESAFARKSFTYGARYLLAGQSGLAHALFTRQIEVLRLIARGASNQGVGDALIRSVPTTGADFPTPS